MTEAEKREWRRRHAVELTWRAKQKRLKRLPFGRRRMPESEERLRARRLRAWGLS